MPFLTTGFPRSPTVRATAAALGLFTAAAIVSCHSSPTGPTKPSAITITIDTVPVAGSAINLERGSHQVFTATVKDSAGKATTIPVVWRSSNDTVAMFRPNGRLATADTGITLITASALGVTSLPVPVHVIWIGAAKIATQNWTPPSAASPGAMDSIHVLVTNVIGGPAASSRVDFAVTSGGGTVASQIVLTDATGLASTLWTLGPSTSLNTVTASSVTDDSTLATWVTGNPATFSINAYPALTIVQGDAQTASLLAALPVAPSVKLVDASGAPRPGVPITFVPTNNGQVGTTTVSTGANGIASPGIWTLGDQPGTEQLIATVSNAKITLSATATGTPIHYMPAQLAAGGFSTCALETSGMVSCWGQEPQIGGGDTVSKTVPTAVAGGKTFASLAPGATHFCAIASDNSISCWGTNTFMDTTGSVLNDSVPTALPSNLAWRQISPGYQHNCGLTVDSTAYCWGVDTSGQLGDNSITRKNAPVPVAGGFKFTTITAGGGHTCALTSAGAAFCWGFNQSGQVGDGSTTNQLGPTAVQGGLTFTAIGAGANFTCGLATSQAYCWGNPQQTTATQDVPILLTSTQTFTSISVGGQHACALTATGAAYCWGDNTFGQLGDSTTTTRANPTAVAGGLHFTAIQAGYQHTCAMTTDGSVACWGNNTKGELGNAKLSPQIVPRFIVLGVKP